jgi:class 3 adenylate cyclase/predicted ATPase
MGYDEPMRCAKCGGDNPAGKKFCSDCGAPLTNRCPKCGAENPPGKHYCGDCGTALAVTSAGAQSSSSFSNTPDIAASAEQTASAVADGERKTVTALFADIKGSTELIAELDPEDARALIDPALKLMVDAVHRYGGYVVQSTGDGIFALFGAPVAYEDHPQRAVYAALRLQESIKSFSAKLIAEGGTPLEARVGINTGEVVVRPVHTETGRAEYTPVGHTSNLAARMQAVAPSGSIAITENTKRLVEGFFQLKHRGPTRVKGLSEPLVVFEVTGVGPLRTRFQRAAGRGLTRFVGRHREIEAMKHAAELAKAGHGQVVAIVGEPGIGKSRLFFEFEAIAQSGCLRLEAFSLSPGKATAYLPVLELLGKYFRILPEDDARTRREKVAGKIVILDRALEDALPYLYALLGIVEGDDPLGRMDAQIRRRRTHDAIKRILLRESVNQPLIVIFEDLHWIDAETEAVLGVLADAIANAPILLLVNYRPEYTHGWGNRSYYTQLRLDPLRVENAEELLSALVGDAAELTALKRLVIEKTEGNPFFIEEMVQALVEQGVLVGNGTIKLARSYSQLRLPATVQGVLSSRIDRLASKEKEILQTLAVIGREFSLSLARHIVNCSDDELDAALAVLQAGEFINELPGSHDIQHAFKHALTQEVAYNSILTGRRKLLHERAAQAFEALFAAQLDDHLSELARHYKRADNIQKAIEYAGRAGQQAIQRCANAEAISVLTDAIDLVQRLPDTSERIERELSLQLNVGPALFAIKGWGSPEAIRAYTRARELCERLNDSPELFPMLYNSCFMHLLRGECLTAHELAEDLMRRAQAANDPRVLLYAHHALGQTLFYLGNLPAGFAHIENAVSLYDPATHSMLTARYTGIDAKVHCQGVVAWILWNCGYPEQAMTRAEAALEWAKQLSHPYSLVFAEDMLIGIHREQRPDAHAAQERAEKGISLCAEYGLPDFGAFASVERGLAIAQQGRGAEGVTQIRTALETLRARGANVELPKELRLLAEACRDSGKIDDGLTALNEALILIEEQENRRDEVAVRQVKGELLLLGGQAASAEAEQCFRKAIEVARNQSAKWWELRATTSLARLLASQGRRDEARTMLAEIYGWFTEGFDTAGLKDAKRLLDELAM